MACGGQFSRHDETIAAHRTLPCGTVLQVTNRKTGVSIRMVVKDRGPFTGNRKLDVSYGAAVKLRFVEAGVVTLDVIIIGTP
jgi:rare lipoprotein A